MARITIQELYSGGGKYSILSDALDDYLKSGKPDEFDERTWLDMLIIKHTVLTVEKMALEGDSISTMFDGESPSSHVGRCRNDNT